MDLIVDRLDEAAIAEAEANRAHARSWAALAEVMRLARANPHLYLRPAGLAEPDMLEQAEDAAAFDAGLRLHLTARQVRNRAIRRKLSKTGSRCCAPSSLSGARVSHM